MAGRFKIPNDPKGFLRFVSIIAAGLLIIFEIIIAVQLVTPAAGVQEAWRVAAFVGCSLVLDVLYAVDMYALRSLKSRIVVYAFDFVLLLLILAITGSPYLAVLYCVILTQIYINVESMQTKTIVFAVSCAMFVITCVVGSLLNRLSPITAQDLLNIVWGNLVGLMAIAIHFAVENFIIGFYRTNAKLTDALKEADDSRKRLEEAQGKLSEAAVLEERNRIARDIHDNAGHSMTAVIMQTEAAKLLIDDDPEAAKVKLISANIQAKNALEQMRESVHLLAGRGTARPFSEEVEEILAQTIDGAGAIIRSDLADVELSPDKRRYLANSLKECLANSVRHGGATALYVELSELDGQITLIVSDNGTGLPENFKEGYGLKGIREKAAEFGGSVIIESESGDGCEIIIKIKSDREAN